MIVESTSRFLSFRDTSTIPRLTPQFKHESRFERPIFRAPAHICPFGTFRWQRHERRFCESRPPPQPSRSDAHKAKQPLSFICLCESPVFCLFYYSLLKYRFCLFFLKMDLSAKKNFPFLWLSEVT
ncbi:hypothetical protein TNCV_832531 [Trichonephila clavipes]|nr:hypothetical protein TNCV_832531 [Trichonephila clavipes]